MSSSDVTDSHESNLVESAQKHTHTYRPDIDGLRAIAILAVVIFHAFPSKLKGGYIGVDVFFVISGYLISSIIMRDIYNEEFSYIRFYINRIKRIFPALIFVLTGCFLFGWYALFSDEFSLLGKHIASGLGFVQNITLYLESGYFDTSAQFKPLLHLWSLGVEEQFYFVFPVLLLFAWRLRNRMIQVVLFCAIATFVLNIFITLNNPTSAFFLPLTRFWEMLFGAVLAYIGLQSSNKISGFMERYPFLEKIKNTHLFNNKFYNFCSSVGFLILVASFFGINKSKIFPGWWALLPTMGALLIILGGPNAWINRHVLGNKVMVWIGLISYPLYLWHWPLFSFGRIILNSESLPVYLSWILIGASFLLAWVTYEFVEKPIRFGGYFKQKTVGLLIVSSILIVAGLLTYRQYIHPRIKSESIMNIVNASNDWAYPGRLEKMTINNKQVFGIPGNKKTLFFGDSNIEQYAPRVISFLQNSSEDRGAVFLTTGACLPINDVKRSASGKAKVNACYETRNNFISVAKDPDIDTIVISAVWFDYFNENTNFTIDNELLSTEEGRKLAILTLQKMIAEVSRPGRRIVIVSNIPIDSSLDPKSLITRDFLHDKYTLKHNYIEKDQLVEKHKGIYSSLKKLAKDNKLIFVDPLDYLCTGNICPAMTDKNMAIYKDRGHLRKTFVENDLTYLDFTLRSFKQ